MKFTMKVTSRNDRHVTSEDGKSVEVLSDVRLTSTEEGRTGRGNTVQLSGIKDCKFEKDSTVTVEIG